MWTGVTGDGGTGDSAETTETSGGGRFLDLVFDARGVTRISKDAFAADSGSGGMSNDVLYAGAEGGGKRKEA